MNLAFDPQSLYRIEDSYRQRLASDPTDHVARVNLAWCLLLQVLHHAGRESMLAELVANSERLDERLDDIINSTLDREIGTILAECLHQSFTVRQLSTDQAEHADVARLQQLVRLVGGEEAVSNAEADALRVVRQLAHAITTSPAAVS
jgi:hypothetical protein